MVSRWTRRQLLGRLGAAGAAGFLVPAAMGRALAASPGDRKFLFILAYGGWDPMFVMAPSFEHSHLHHPANSFVDDSGPLTFVSADERRATADFLHRYGAIGCILNGVEVPSITHEQCRKLILTGQRDGRVDDWGAILGGNSTGFDLPSVVVSGPAYGDRYTSSQLRLGPDGQLADLISGDALSASDTRITAPSSEAQDAVQAWVRSRRASWPEQAPVGSEAFSQGLADSEVQLARLDSLGDDVDLAIESDGFLFMSQRVEPALELLELGLTRCASVVHLGEWDANWDSHSGIEKQSAHFEFLFNDLATIFASMETRGLLESTTVVVLSEMGRTPQLNGLGGKDHWTFTSAMLFGDGVQGGQVLGGYTEDWLGAEHDGRVLSTLDLGATLLAMGDLDPAEHLPAGTPITQAMSD